MMKYSEEFKLKLVNEYLAGPLGYPRLARKYGIFSHGQIARWVRAFKAVGKEGLRNRQKYHVYSVQFKMHNPRLIVKWKQTFLAEGGEGLRKKGRPPMAKNPKKKPEKRLGQCPMKNNLNARMSFSVWRLLI